MRIRDSVGIMCGRQEHRQIHSSIYCLRKEHELNVQEGTLLIPHYYYYYKQTPDLLDFDLYFEGMRKTEVNLQLG